MKKISEFIKKERLYILLLIFVMLAGSLVAVAGHSKSKAAASSAASVAEQSKSPDDLLSKRQQTEKILQENKPVAVIFTVASLLMLLVLVLGIAIDCILLVRQLSGRPIEIRTYKLKTVKWDVLDVIRVILLFLFFGYMLIMIESFLAKTFPIIKDNDLRAVFNSSLLDILLILSILNFAVQEHKESLKSLGIAANNFFHNVFYGVVGYIAALPGLFLILLTTTFVTNFFRYTSKEQVVVDMFMRQSNPTFLIYTGIFAAIAGPIVEELFFRGFMYGAVRKRVGILPAILITSVLFALLHAHAVGFLPIMALGILLAYLYEKTGTLVTSITVHVLHNLCMISLVFLAKSVKGF